MVTVTAAVMVGVTTITVSGAIITRGQGYSRKYLTFCSKMFPVVWLVRKLLTVHIVYCKPLCPTESIYHGPFHNKEIFHIKCTFCNINLVLHFFILVLYHGPLIVPILVRKKITYT